MVLKQCGQEATIFFRAGAPASFSVSTFCWASIWNTNSLPIRRAGSPVQVSAGPSTANFTPAVCSSAAMALVVFFARSSSAPGAADPEQVLHVSVDLAVHDGDLEVELGDPLQRACPRPCPTGCPCSPGSCSIPAASWGNADSISTWWRRIPSMWSMCSMSTGHSSTQAPQFVQDQSTSGSITPFSSAVADQRPAPPRP